MKEDWQPRSSPAALLVGNYLHSYFESSEAHQAFVETNHDALTLRNGKTLRAEYRQADKMIATLDQDERFQQLYQGDKEVIVTGKIDGQLWKGKIDCLNLAGGYFVDLKTNRDLDQQVWSPEDRRRYGFIKNYGYYYQMAMYQELIQQTFGVTCLPFIVAVSKQDVPAKRAFDFSDIDDQYELQDALAEIKAYQPRIEEIMNGEIKPKRCGTCEYCRETSQLELVNASSLND